MELIDTATKTISVSDRVRVQLWEDDFNPDWVRLAHIRGAQWRTL